MEEYKCKICNEKHSFFFRLENTLPESVKNIDKSQRKSRVQKMDDSILIIDEDKVSLKGIIEIHLDFLNKQSFTLGAWLTIDKEAFEQTMKNAQKSDLAIFEGKLDCIIPFYKEVKGLAAKGIINFFNNSIQIIVTENSKIRKDQESPISKDRLIELMDKIQHPKPKKKNNPFKKDFRTRANDIFNQFTKDNIPSDLIIDISTHSQVLFQIVNRISLEEIDNTANGFGLHLAFDDLDDQNITYFNNLLASSIYSSAFKYYKLDDVDICQIDLRDNQENLIYMITEVLTQVYQEDPENIHIQLL